MTSNKLIRFALLPAYRPIQGIRGFLNNPHRLVYGVVIFLFLGAVYTLSVQLAYMQGIGAVVEPFLKIPAAKYYFWQRFWQIPFFFITSIVFAGTVRLLSAMINGKGSFEDIFALFCIAQTLPMFLTMWLPETVGFIFFPGKIIMPLWLDIARQIAGIIWPLIISIAGITMVEKIKWFYSLLFSLIAAIPITLLMVIFIR